MADEYTKRSSDGKFNWQALAVILSVLMALSAFGKAYFLSDYRLGEVEKHIDKVEARLDRIEERQIRLQSTYDILVDQAREHGWVIPWQGRRR